MSTSRNSKQRRNKKSRLSGGYEDINETAIQAQRNQSDSLFKQNTLASNNIYDTVSAVDYGQTLETRGGKLNQKQNRQQRKSEGGKCPFSGGCFTCSKGKKKLSTLSQLFAKLIPKLYSQYQKRSPKTKTSNKKKIVKGGLLDWSDWDGSYVWKPNPTSGVFKFDDNIMDTGFLNLSNRTNQGIYNVDTSLTDYTSSLGR